MFIIVFRKLYEYFGGKRSVPGLHFLFSRSVAAKKMEGIAVLLQKKRRELSQCVLLTKKSPYTILVIWVAMGKLYGFQLSKLRN